MAGFGGGGGIRLDTLSRGFCGLLPVSVSDVPPPPLPLLAFPAPPEIPFRLSCSLAARSLIKSPPPPPTVLPVVSTASSCFFFFLIFVSLGRLNLFFSKPRIAARRLARPASAGSDDVVLSDVGLHHNTNCTYNDNIQLHCGPVNFLQNVFATYDQFR